MKERTRIRLYIWTSTAYKTHYKFQRLLLLQIVTKLICLISQSLPVPVDTIPILVYMYRSSRQEYFTYWREFHGSCKTWNLLFRISKSGSKIYLLWKPSIPTWKEETSLEALGQQNSHKTSLHPHTCIWCSCLWFIFPYKASQKPSVIKFS